MTLLFSTTNTQVVQLFRGLTTVNTAHGALENEARIRFDVGKHRRNRRIFILPKNSSMES